MSTLPILKLPVKFGPSVAIQFPITDRSRVNQFPAVGASARGSKGLETDGHKVRTARAIDENRRAPSIERRRDRVTAGNTFNHG